MKKELRLGIAYNVYFPELDFEFHPSEELVEDMAREVYEALKSAGYWVTLLPLGENLFEFFERMKREEIDVVINLCEGYLNQSRFEPSIAAVYEMLDLPFTGNDSLALAICQDKFKTKAILRAFGLPTPHGQLVSSPEEKINLPFPLIVKPACEDASVGINLNSVVDNEEALRLRIEEIVKKYQQPALVEEFIDGREFNVALLGIEGQGVQALPVSEIDFSSLPENIPRICCYEAKWFEDHELYQATPPVCPARINERLRRKLQSLAVAAFKAMGCRDYARVDLRLSSRGEPYILEVNPNPDISLNAGYARALRAASLPYHKFWEIMINNALERKRKSRWKKEVVWPYLALDSSREQILINLMERAAHTSRKGGRW
jgi:D-alanine-D-alanine ligase